MTRETSRRAARHLEALRAMLAEAKSVNARLAALSDKLASISHMNQK